MSAINILSDDSSTKFSSRDGEFFLNAALQLLDERDEVSIQKDVKNLSAINPIRPDVIRTGILRKASRVGALSNVNLLWKPKVVEVTYGLFTYYDEDNISNVKTIILTSEKSYCRSVRLRAQKSECIFELSASGVRRIFHADSSFDRDAWINAIRNAMTYNPGDLCYSPQPRHDFSSQFLKKFSPFRPNHSQTRKVKDVNRSDDFTFNATDEKTNSITAASNSPKEISPTLTKNVMLASEHSRPGPAALYIQQVAKFCSVQAKLSAAKNIDDYRIIIGKLMSQGFELQIPVFFVKSISEKRLHGVNFRLTPEDALKRCLGVNGLTYKQSQVWKDLQRDKLRINGRLITGREKGGAALVVGSLTHNIMLKAKDIRLGKSKNHSSPSASNDTPHDKNDVIAALNQPEDASVSNRLKTGAIKPQSHDDCGLNGYRTSEGSIKNLRSSSTSRVRRASEASQVQRANISNANANIFDLSEADALCCARDLLVLCNRTQSGGDSYFCVDALLAWCGQGREQKSDRYCVLTPLNLDAEPVDIIVDIVEDVGEDFVGIRASISTESLVDDVLGEDDSCATSLLGDIDHEGMAMGLEYDDFDKKLSKSDEDYQYKSDKSSEEPIPQSFSVQSSSDFSDGSVNGYNAKTKMKLQPPMRLAGFADVVLSETGEASPRPTLPYVGYGVPPYNTRSLSTPPVKDQDLMGIQSSGKAGELRFKIYLDDEDEIEIDDGSDIVNISDFEEKRGANLSADRDVKDENKADAISRSHHKHGERIGDDSKSQSLESDSVTGNSVISDLTRSDVDNDSIFKSKSTGNDMNLDKRIYNFKLDSDTDLLQTSDSKHFRNDSNERHHDSNRTSLRFTDLIKKKFSPFSNRYSISTSQPVLLEAVGQSDTSNVADEKNDMGWRKRIGATFSQHFGGDSSASSSRPSSLDRAKNTSSNNKPRQQCIRIQVKALSQYRVCCADPQGDDSDLWCVISAHFSQCFYIRHGNGHATVGDRLVAIKFEPLDANPDTPPLS